MSSRLGDDRSATAVAAPRLSVSALPAAKLALTPRLWALLFLLGLLWGGSFFFTQIAIREIAPLPLVAIRVGLAAFALLVFLPLARQSMAPLRERALAFLGLGLVSNAIPFLLLAIGQQTIGGGLAAILNATTPLWTILVATLATRDERLSPNKLAGVALGLGGVAVLVGPEAISGGSGAPLTAVIVILGATLSYACAGVYAKRFRGVPPVVVAAGQLCGSSTVMVPLALVTAGWPSLAALQALSAGAIAAMLALALVSTAFAYILYFELVAGAGATNASLVTFLVPASAILLGILVLGETLAIREIFGFALILVGLVAVDGRWWRGRTA